MIRLPPAVAAVWTALRRRAGGSSDFDLLARTFLDRFFENEITGGSADLKMSFFWLLAFLAVPGMAMGFLLAPNWGLLALFRGPEALRLASEGNKLFYLAYSAIASGAVAVIVWDSLLLDRRDALVLGVLPVRGATIVRAKLTALCVYVGIVTVVMHAPSSVAFGFFLAAKNSVGFAFAGIIAHFVASAGVSVFLILAVTATQGLLFAAIGPRAFWAVAPILQIVLVATLLLGLVFIPDFDYSGSPSGPASWLSFTPPYWFLGTYESVLTTSNPTFIVMNRLAMSALAGVAALTLVSYPLAYRHLVSSVVEAAVVRTRPWFIQRITGWIVIGLGRSAGTRASVQFLLAGLGRLTRHRFVAAGAIGISISLGVPTLIQWLSHLSPADTHILGGPTPAAAVPPIPLLAVPIETMVVLLVGLRIAASLPADLRAGWAFDCIGARPAPLRAGVWRAMFAIGVAPIAVACAPLYWRAWGAPFALTHVLVCLVLGAALTEALLWGFDGMPCSRPWRPEHAGLRKWWPAYLALFLFLTGGLPAIEQLFVEQHTEFVALIVIIAAVGVVLRITHRRRRIIPDDDLDEPMHVQVLNLD